MEKFNKLAIVAIVAIVITVIISGCSENNPEPPVQKEEQKQLPVITVTLPSEFKDKIRVEIKYSEAPKAEPAAPSQVPAVIKIGSLDEYRTLEVLKANEEFARQELADEEKHLKMLKEDKASIEKLAASDKIDRKTARQKLMLLDIQERLTVGRINNSKKWLQEQIEARTKAEEAIKQRDAANKKNYAWYNPKGWF